MNTKTTKIIKYNYDIKKMNCSDIRKTLMTILERDLENIKNKTILEVGCGEWDFAKKIFEKNQCKWHGFEPVNLYEKNLTIVKGSVKKIPYHNNSFERVLCNQTMEHWFEYNVSLKKALKDINRVLKPNGILMINAPIHVHGDPRFLMGELDKIKKIFKKKLWKIILFEKVYPLEKTQRWKKISSRGFFSKIGYPNILIPHSRHTSSYIINIHAKKIEKRKLRTNKNRILLRHLTVLIRFIKTYFKTRF